MNVTQVVISCVAAALLALIALWPKAVGLFQRTAPAEAWPSDKAATEEVLRYIGAMSAVRTPECEFGKAVLAGQSPHEFACSQIKGTQ